MSRRPPRPLRSSSRELRHDRDPVGGEQRLRPAADHGHHCVVAVPWSATSARTNAGTSSGVSTPHAKATSQRPSSAASPRARAASGPG